MKVLITGAGGQLGREIDERFSGTAHHEVVACTRAELDLGDRDSVLGTITSYVPDLIVHAGAYTAVDAAETDTDTAFRINAMATRHVVQAARIVEARVLYVSTDYVFDGTKADPYDEWNTPNPQTVYGRSKLGGERELRDIDTTVRTSWVFGRYGNNIVKTLLALGAQSDRTLTFVTDQVGRPTCAADLAETIYQLGVGRHSGIFHASNAGAVSWFEFAQSVFTAAGFDPARIKPVTTDELVPPRAAPRPRNSVLGNAALRYAGLSPLPDHRDSLAKVLKELQS